jgi:hypothetical protein
MAAPQIKSSYGPPKGGGYHGSGSTKTYVKAYPPKGFGKGPSKNYGSDSIGQGSTQTFTTTTTTFGKGPSKNYGGSDSVGHGSTQTYTTASYGSGKGSSPGKGSQTFSSTSYGSKGKKQHQSFGDLIAKGTQTYGRNSSPMGVRRVGRGSLMGSRGKGTRTVLTRLEAAAGAVTEAGMGRGSRAIRAMVMEALGIGREGS